MLFQAKFKPSMLEKWRVNPPKHHKLAKMRRNMTGEERQLTAAFAWEQGWPKEWLAMLPDDTAAELLADCWAAGDVAAQKAVLSGAINLLKRDRAHRSAACQLLRQLADEHTVNLLLAAALSYNEAALGSFSAELLCDILSPWREQTGRALLILFADLSRPAKKLALQLCGLLKPANAAAILAPALTDEDEAVRALSAKTAGILPPESLPGFLSPALADKADAVRTAACETLGLHAGVAAIPLLRRMFDTDEAWTVKSMCSSFISKWENALAEQIRIDEGELFLKDSHAAPEEQHHAED